MDQVFIPAEYVLLTGTNEALSAKVNHHLSEGWRLYGDPTITQHAAFAQAMVRSSEDKQTYEHSLKP